MAFATLQPVSAVDPLEWAFPNIDPGVEPFGHRVLVQLRTPMLKSKGGIILADESRETEFWNTQVAKVLAVGPLAFRNRTTGEPWKEGSWCGPGDFVRAPKYGGDRWRVPIPGRDKNGEPALFVIFNDVDLIGKVSGDPLKMEAYVG